MNLMKLQGLFGVLIILFSWIGMSALFYYYHPLNNSKNNSPQTNMIIKTHILFSDQNDF